MGKGLQDENQTGFDILAEYLSMCGISVPPIQTNGHYTYAAIVNAIQSINMTPPAFSKACSVEYRGSSIVASGYGVLKVGGVTLTDNWNKQSGTFTIDINGNITAN